MGKRYFVLGTFFGIQLRVDYSWFIIFILVTWTVITGYLPSSYKHTLPPLALVGTGLLVTIIFFVSVILHEYAHSLVANRRGLRIKRITLFVFGGASELRHEPQSAQTELLMTIAGPLTSLVIAGIFASLWLLARQWHLSVVALICQPVATLNLVVALFNLLPAFPLDGGRILRAAFWLIYKDFSAATRIATNASVVLSYVTIGVGILAFLGGNLAGGLWFVIIGFFLLQSARFSYLQTVVRNLLAKVRVADIYSSQFAAVPMNTTVEDFLSDYVLQYKQHDFVVIDHLGTPIGAIEMNQVTRGGRGNYQNRIDEYIQVFTKNLILKPTDPATKALRLMRSNNVDILPVVADGKLLGVVTQQYLEDYIAVHRLQQHSEAGPQ